MGYDDNIKPDPKILRIRHELMKQIKLSNIKLDPIKDLPPLKLIRDIPIYANETVSIDKLADWKVAPEIGCEARPNTPAPVITNHPA
jgi:hypothetical protein